MYQSRQGSIKRGRTNLSNDLAISLRFCCECSSCCNCCQAPESSRISQTVHFVALRTLLTASFSSHVAIFQHSTQPNHIVGYGSRNGLTLSSQASSSLKRQKFKRKAYLLTPKKHKLYLSQHDCFAPPLNPQCYAARQLWRALGLRINMHSKRFKRSYSCLRSGSGPRPGPLFEYEQTY